MNKTQLIDTTAEHSGLTKAQTAQAINAAIEVIQAAVAAGEQVVIPGFGAFDAVAKPERTGRNPQTGAQITIAASRAPKFKPGAGFKGLVNASKALTNA